MPTSMSLRNCSWAPAPKLIQFFTSSSGDIIDMLADGSLKGPGLFSLVLGVKYGFSATPETMFYARSLLPPGAIWSGFGIGRAEFPMVAQAHLLGGHVRVGMEDNLYMSKGVLAKTNAELVSRAADILHNLGAEIASAKETRAMLKLA